MKNKRGFTMIELLIVVFIIALLTSIIVVIAQNVLKKTRDTKRMADISTIQKALEMFYNDNGRYPCSNRNYFTTFSLVGSSCGTNWCLLENALNGTDVNMDGLADANRGTNYLDKLPREPQGSSNSLYQYIYDADPLPNGDNCQTYGLMVMKFESNAYSLKASQDGGFNNAAYEIGRQPAWCMTLSNSAQKNWYLTQYICNGINP